MLGWRAAGWRERGARWVCEGGEVPGGLHGGGLACATARAGTTAREAALDPDCATIWATFVMSVHGMKTWKAALLRTCGVSRGSAPTAMRRCTKRQTAPIFRAAVAVADNTPELTACCSGSTRAAWSTCKSERNPEVEQVRFPVCHRYSDLLHSPSHVQRELLAEGGGLTRPHASSMAPHTTATRAPARGRSRDTLPHV